MSPPGPRPADERQASAPAQPAGETRPAGSGTDGQPAAAPAGDAGEPAASGGGVDDVDGHESLPKPSWGGWERLIRVFGVAVSVIAAFVTGVFELLLTTMRAGDLLSVWRGDSIGSGGGPLIGLSVLLAIAGNLGIAWFAVTTTGRRWAVGPPWALWTLLMLFAAGVRTSEGDYLVSGTNWVAVAMILIGSLAFAIYTYRLILKRILPAGSPPAGKSN
jgi:hypothetical protein